MAESEQASELHPCPRCGALTTVGTGECASCGLNFQEAAAALAAHRETLKARKFLASVLGRSNRFAPLFVGINVAIFVLMWLAGGMGFLSANEAVLIGFGAKVNPLINEQQQYWRLITCMFLHIGFLHLFFNNYALWMIGRELESFYGSSRFVLIYLLTGIAGSLASYLFNPKAISAGASGAIFGLFGAMVTFPLRYRKELPDLLRKGILKSILPVIVINLLIGRSAEFIDESAHIGGLMMGALLALVIPYKRPGEESARVWRVLLVVCLLAIVTSFVLAAANYRGPALRLANLPKQGGNQAALYYTEMNHALTAIGKSGEAFIKILDQRNPQVDSQEAQTGLENALRHLEQVPTINEESERYRQRLRALVLDYQAMIERYRSSESKDWDELIGLHTAWAQKASAYLSAYDIWVKEFMQRNGYELRES